MARTIGVWYMETKVASGGRWLGWKGYPVAWTTKRLRCAKRPLLLALAIAALSAGADPLAMPDEVQAAVGPSQTPESLALEEEIGLLEPKARHRWPNSFAGIWGSEDGRLSHLYVAFVGDARHKVAELTEGFSAPNLLVPVSARYSLAHLERLQERMIADREAARNDRNPIPGLIGARYDLDINLEENAVEVLTPTKVETVRTGVTQAYGDSSEPKTDDVRVIRGGLSQPYACSDRAHCGLQLRAGLRVLFTKEGAESFCGSAFVATGPTLLSAAHCGDAGIQPDKENSRYHRGEINPANFYGTVGSQVHSGRVDAELHSIGNGFTGNPWVYLTQDIQASPVYSVGTWDALIENVTRLCKAGPVTGYTCGVLRSKNYAPPEIPNGNRFLGVQLETADPKYPGGSYFGDSGAPFVRESPVTQAEGILHGGGGGSCGCWTIAGHIEYATQALGVNVKLAPPPSSPPPPNIRGILMNGTGTGKTEIHVLDAATNYSTFALQVATALEQTTASQWQFSFGDYNRDGIPDLIGVLMNGTGSGKTEVHILNGATNYSTFLLHGVSGLNTTTSSQWQFTVGDYNQDGIPDLIGVLMNGTGSGKTEVHILNGATNYSTFLLATAVDLGETTASQWQFTVGDYNRDGAPDLMGILMKGTGTGKTEVHILNGATNYSFALLRTGTGLEETKPQQWQFSAGDFNGDGIPDLLGVLMNGTGTRTTEVHILDGASNYTSFLIHAGTALGETTASQWQFAGAHVSGDWHPLVTTEPASNISTEEATLNGAVNPQGISTTYHFDYGTTTSYGSSTPESGSIGAGTSNVAVTQAISALSPGTTYHFRVVATNLEGTSYGQDRTFKTGSTGTAGQLSGMVVTEPFNGTSNSLANFSSTWGTLGWASGTAPKGSDTTSGWRPVDAYPTVNGAFYSPTITDTGQGIAAVATMAANPANAERHFSVWLDMPNPASSTRAGYELRFTMVSTGIYNVTLSRWQAGTETVLASKSSYAFANGNSLAVLDQGGTVSAWTNTGSGFSQLLSASDATFSSGSAGIQGAGNITRLTNFKTGALFTPVAGMDAALNSLPVNDAFATNENPLSGGGAWAALAWDNSTSGHNTGRVEGGWGPYDAYSTINGAYWQKASFADSGAGDAVAAKLAGNPTIASRYFSLWLNAPSPGSTRSGYELRFTETSSSVYEVALSKWQSGAKTILASKVGYSFPVGSQFALAAKAGTVSVWTKTGSEYTQLLSSSDSTFISGYTSIEGSGNITRLKEFRSGSLSPF